MKRILYFLSVAVAMLALASCGNKAAQEQAEEGPMSVDSLIANAEQLVDSVVTFEGVCSHTCAHGATKMFVIGSDDTKSIRVEAGELGSFDTKVVHNPVVVTGKLVEERVDEAVLVQWEEQMKAKAAEEHGNGEAGCDHEKANRGLQSNTMADQIAEYRARIAERDSIEGKPYLSFFYVIAHKYDVVE